MVVVVPTLAEADEAAARNVVALHRSAFNMPVLGAAPMRKVSHPPVSCQADTDPQAHPPQNPARTAQCIQKQGPWQLLRHPRALYPHQEAVVLECFRYLETRWARKFKFAVQLPPGVMEERAAVREVVVALRLSLGPIAKVVGSHHAHRACHSNQRTEVDEQAFHPARTLVAAMNEAAVHAQRMPQAQRGGAH